MNWYCVCYDTYGDGFRTIQAPYCFVLGEEELAAAIEHAVQEEEIKREQICVFELVTNGKKSKFRN